MLRFHMPAMGKAGNQEQKQKAIVQSEVMTSMTMVCKRCLDFFSNSRRNCRRMAILTMPVAVGYNPFDMYPIYIAILSGHSF